LNGTGLRAGTAQTLGEGKCIGYTKWSHEGKVQMSGFDKYGERVEDLARVTRDELVQWVDQASLARNRAKRHADTVLLAKRQADLRTWYEQSLADMQREHAEACEALPRLEARLERLHAELDRKREASPRATAKPSAERQARVDALLARVQRVDVTAIAELKALI
jgi:hypothetical protein